MHLAQAHELGARQAGQRAQHALLVAPLEAALEADEVEVGARQVLLPQLHDGPGAAAVGRGEADRLHRPVTQRVDAAPRHFLDRQAALEERALEVVQRQHLGARQAATKARTVAVSGR